MEKWFVCVATMSVCDDLILFIFVEDDSMVLLLAGMFKLSFILPRSELFARLPLVDQDADIPLRLGYSHPSMIICTSFLTIRGPELDA